MNLTIHTHRYRYAHFKLILLYGVEPAIINNEDLKFLDFIVDRFLMQVFKSSDIAVINECSQFLPFRYAVKMFRHRKG